MSWNRINSKGNWTGNHFSKGKQRCHLIWDWSCWTGCAKFAPITASKDKHSTKQFNIQMRISFAAKSRSTHQISSLSVSPASIWLQRLKKSIPHTLNLSSNLPTTLQALNKLSSRNIKCVPSSTGTLNSSWLIMPGLLGSWRGGMSMLTNPFLIWSSNFSLNSMKERS